MHEVLFPYARARLAAFVAEHRDALAPVLAQVRAEAGQLALDDGACVAQLLAWHDADCKVTPLKTIHGMIWAQGYADGHLVGHVYADAAAGLQRWHDLGIALYVYSSGSVAAQKLLFGHTASGDLTPLFSGYFDTAIGGKKEVASYRAIAGEIGLDPSEILFLSDVAAELAAAREAGYAVSMLARDDEAGDAAYPVARSFDALSDMGVVA